ncbi:MAG: lysostaphin resistance A-like protein [Planctomycetota bacterium]
MWSNNGDRPRGQPGVAWLVIIAAVLITAVLHRVGASVAAEDDEDPVGLTIMQLQSKYMVGLANSGLFAQDATAIYQGARFILNTGTVGQRQRAIIVAADLVGIAEARDELGALEVLIAAPPVGGPVELSEGQASVQRILHELYPKVSGDDDAEQAAVGAAEMVSPRDRTLLIDELGWFGELALAPAGSADTAARDAVIGPARIVATVVISAAVAGVMALGVGFIGLVLVIVLVCIGQLISGFGSARPWHGVYAETFAVWLVLFLGLQVLADWIATPATEMPVTMAMFFASLIALAWPVLRGIPWTQVRTDIGWTLGRLPLAEPVIGLGGYLMTLPLLAMGLGVTLVLMWLQGAVAGAPPTFAPTGGPAHPIIVHMAGAAVWPKINLLILAAVAAPIVEETMFRGVLYRHLRDASARLGLVVSIGVSILINTFVFAAIHPQGLVAVPALMSLACGMALVREWRGTLIPAMVIHGVSNGLIMGTLMVVLSV